MSTFDFFYIERLVSVKTVESCCCFIVELLANSASVAVVDVADSVVVVVVAEVHRGCYR